MAGRKVATKEPTSRSATVTIGNFLRKNAAVLGAEELRKRLLGEGSKRVGKKPPKRK